MVGFHDDKVLWVARVMMVGRYESTNDQAYAVDLIESPSQDC